MNLKRLGLMAVVFWAAGMCFVPCVFASPVYTGTYVEMYLKQNTFPSGLLEEKVYLDAALASTITGHVGSQTDARLVTFSSTTDTLDAANGFANIKAQDGYINNITITAPGYWFSDLIFSVNLSKDNTDLTVTATDKSGGTDPFSGWTLGSGQNDILVLSKGANLMQSVTINSLIGSETLGGLTELKQTQISGLTPVPIPPAIWLMGTGLLSLIGIRRRFRK